MQTVFKKNRGKGGAGGRKRGADQSRREVRGGARKNGLIRGKHVAGELPAKEVGRDQTPVNEFPPSSSCEIERIRAYYRAENSRGGGRRGGALTLKWAGGERASRTARNVLLTKEG